MDFYSRQAAARSQTRWLVIFFLLSLLAVALALDAVLFTVFGSAGYGELSVGPLQYAALNPGRALFCTLFIIGVLGLASLYKSLELRGGGGVVARSLGGIRIGRDTTDFRVRRLHNIVEEMAIASGVPMPEIYVLEQESGINAFAAGHTPANAAITVTQGALDNLNREQLQGVIAHEFSHILNGDMRLNIQLMGWVFGLFVVALIGRIIMQFSPRGRRNGNSLIAVGLAVMALGYVGLFFGRLLQAAVSRQRERLADASGVQFTRNPEGLKDALIRIAALPEGSALHAAGAEQAAHMLFAEGLSRMFATHPPLLERIRDLDPHFDPKQLPEIAAALERQSSLDDSEPEPAAAQRAAPAAGSPANLAVQMTRPAQGMTQAAGIGTAAAVLAATAGGASQAAPDAQAIAASVGNPQTLHIAEAKAMRLALPAELREFSDASSRAQTLVLAMLLSRDPAVREHQLALLDQAVGEADAAAVRRAGPVADDLEPLLRLPALQQLFPALRRMPLADRKALAALAGALIRADNRVDVFEFCLAKLLESLLNDELTARAPHGSLTLEDAQAQIAVLFATLAQVGTPDERAARVAYEAGLSSVLPMRRPEFQAMQDWPRRLEEALPTLEALHPFAKKAVIEGLVRTIASDDLMTVEEAELLRALCALLHCPLPVLVSFGQPQDSA